MNRSVMLLAALFFLGAGDASLAQDKEGPRIFAPERRYEAGRVQQGTQVSHVFDIKNVGTKILVIERVQPS
ncbi:MAG: hypothetical protein A2078_09095 [Nitrospirae bacterium GWC2_57_9]|nr:MAG: hypothetical protein A2078_09095 [Nitrospirae bacterium GWC2_57_9]